MRYVSQRLLLAFPTLVGISIVVFLAVRLIPGNIVDQILEGERDPHLRQELARYYRLDESPVTAYLRWIGGVLRGDFGRSFVSRDAVSAEIRTRFPVTAELAVIALIVSIGIAVPIGIVSALRPESLADHAARSLAVALIAVPSFWLGLLVITYGFAWFNWTPPLRFQRLVDHPVENLKLVLPPALILGASLSGSVMRLTRSSVLDVIRQDYVRTAWSKGLTERQVVLRHVMRNALIPVITVIGLQVPVLLGGSVVMESLFSLPGMGTYLLRAIQQRDYPVVQAVVLLTATFVVVTNIIVDLAYSAIDPRIRYGRR
jgi:peptide/nickel transport system permease protein